MIGDEADDEATATSDGAIEDEAIVSVLETVEFSSVEELELADIDKFEGVARCDNLIESCTLDVDIDFLFFGKLTFLSHGLKGF